MNRTFLLVPEKLVPALAEALKNLVPALAEAPKENRRIGIRLYMAMLLLLFFASALFAEPIALQGFEQNPADTWNYTTNTVTAGYWGLMDDSFGGANAQSGTQYWASWNMGQQEGTLTFDNQQLPLGYVYNLSFFYYTRLLSSPTEYCHYSLSYDNGITWSQWTDLLPNTQAWTSVTIQIPVYVRQVMLKVAAKHGGTSKYAHWDSFSLNKEEAPPTAPSIYNLQVAQRTDGSGLVDIYYDLFDVNNDTSEISLLVSEDGGSSYNLSPSQAYLSGDIGAGITGGTGKHIVWTAGAESYQLEGDQYKLRLVAEDGYFTPVPGNFTFVQGGTFSRQNSDGSYPDPQVMITLNSFYIDKFELTQTGYQAVMGSNPSYFAGNPNRPVEQVSWFDAIEYCNRRSILEGLTPCFSYTTFGTNPNNWPSGWNTEDSNHTNVNCNWAANGYRLPTEMEWMFAAKGGNLSQGYIYSGSNNVNNVAWYDQNSGNRTHNVGELASNELGIFDMSGNVWEWVWDIWNSSYPIGNQINPTGSTTGSYRLIRGCGWNLHADHCTVWYRSSYSGATNVYKADGFRCVRNAAIEHASSPTFNPPAGSYNTAQNVAISTTTSGAIIRYTIDGSEPTESSTIYTTPISISTNTTLKAKAYKANWQPSETATASYVFAPAGFIYVPGGTFTMGDTRGGGNSDELPTHNVTLSSYYIGKYEVTQSEWQAVMGDNPANGFGVGDNYPVYYVSWYATLKYCNLRSINEGLTPVYSINGSTNPTDWGAVPTSDNSTWNAVICNWSANGYRLPTEAEWEYSARGASNTPDYLYSGSDDINSVAWYGGNNTPAGTKMVGTKTPNDIEAYDMSGNVWEWCWDWYSSTYYSSSPSSNPSGPTNGASRVFRGGYWTDLESYCRIASRGGGSPFVYYAGGLRLCRATDNMVLVEGGTFNNGTSNVTLSSFYIDKYEVTQASYQAVMGYNLSYFTGNLFRPVEQVMWFSAIEYCNRRSIQEGHTPCYNYSTFGSDPSNWPSGWNSDYNNHTNVSCNWSVNGYRLPTEMEWMYAARGGNQTHGYIYSGSMDISEVGWFYSDLSHPVGTLLPNELGIYDMSGNVWEWVWDIFDTYPTGDQINPRGAINGGDRVQRGGSWAGGPNYCTVSYRSSSIASDPSAGKGFRVCRSAP